MRSRKTTLRGNRLSGAPWVAAGAIANLSSLSAPTCPTMSCSATPNDAFNRTRREQHFVGRASVAARRLTWFR